MPLTDYIPIMILFMRPNKHKEDTTMALRPRGIGINTQSFLVEENQTVFNLQGRYKMYMNDISIYLDGKKQVLGTDYLETSETAITFMKQLTPLASVEAVWLQVPRIATEDHSYTHSRGGIDELTARDIRNSIQVVNILDFGAIGNGIADDTKAMQMAITYAKFFQADEVYFPTGKYNVGIVTNFTNITLVGTGVQFVGTNQYEINNIDTLEKKAQDIYFKLNDISIHQINKNYGKFDQTFMSDEFLEQIAGTAALYSIPADGSITTVKLADKSVTSAKLGDESVKTTHLDNGSVTVGKLAPGVLNSILTSLPVLQSDPVDPKLGQMWILEPGGQ